MRARRPFPVTPSTLRPAGLAEWRPEALRPVNIDTNVPETTEKRDKSPRLAPELESSLKRYGSYTELKRAALIIAAAQTDKRSVKKLREEFLKIDTDASGTINEAELCAALGVAELDARFATRHRLPKPPPPPPWRRGRAALASARVVAGLSSDVAPREERLARGLD